MLLLSYFPLALRGFHGTIFGVKRFFASGIFLWMVALLLLAVAGLGALQLEARQRELLRGWEVEPQPVADTGMNRACVVAAMEQYNLDERAQMWDAITGGGFVWVRQRFDWAAIEPRPGRFDWAQWDAIVSEGVSRGVQFIAVLDHPPDWAGSPPDPAAFADFAAAFANHYQAQIVYYQLLHNPNLAEGWDGEAADAAAYAELLAAVAPAIRAADPDARIVLGSLAPTVEGGPRNYAEPLFLEMLYAEGAAPYFDVVAVQPYGFQTGPEDRRLAPDLLNFSRPLLVRQVMEAHGEGDKALWASDFGWNSLPPDWDEVPSIWGSVDEATQARYTVEALARIEREWPWMGVACLNNLQPRPDGEGGTPDAESHWGFALIAPDGEPRPVYEAVRDWNMRPRVATAGVWPAATPCAHYEGAWRLGPLGADIGASGDRVRFTFRGTDVALTVRRGPYRAFLFVTVDGRPAPALPRDEEGRAYIVLYDPLAAVATVPLAEGLEDGVHTVEVVADRGWYRWALVDWRVAERPPMRWLHAGRWLFGLMAALGTWLMVVAARRTPWRAWGAALRRRWAALPDWVRTLLALTQGALFSLGAWLSWAQGLFRRLGEGREMGVVLLAALLFYLSPWALLTFVSGATLFILLLLEPSLGLALTMAAAPFYLQPLSLFGRSFALSELLLLMTLAAFAVRYVAQEGMRPVPRKALLRSSMPVLFYLAVGLLASLCAAHRHEALREFRIAMLEPALFFLLMIAALPDWRSRLRVLDLWLVGGLIVAGVGLVGYFLLGDVITAEGGALRLRSIYGSPNNVALYLGRLLPFLVAMLLWGEGRRRWFYGAALVPVATAFLLTLSRGGILLGLPAALVVMGWLAGGRWRKATAAVLVLFALALVPLFRTPRFASLLDLRHGTTFLRLSLWRSAWAMFRDHPWLGVGPDNFLYAYRTRYVLPSAWEEFNLSHPHNFLLDWLTRLGLPGTALFFWMEGRFWRQVVAATRRLRGWQRALALGAAGAMAEALAHGLVDAAFFYVDLAYVFFLLLALAEGLDCRRDAG